MKGKKKIVVSIISLILVICGTIIIAIGVKSNQQLNNEKQIKETVIGALKIYYQMPIYPTEYTKSPDIQIPQEVIDKKLKEVTQACEKYFSSKSGWLENRLKVYKDAVVGEAYSPSGIRDVENKITDIKFSEIKIEGDKATVTVDVFGKNKSIGLALDTDKIPASELNEITNVKGYKMSPEEQKKFIERTEKLPKKIVLVTLTERKTQFGMIFVIPSKESSYVRDLFIKLQGMLGDKFNEVFESVTIDNGSEFSEFGKVLNELGSEGYYTHPYSAYKRGTNERMNGLIRCFLPKGKEISKISKEAIKRV